MGQFTDDFRPDKGDGAIVSWRRIREFCTEKPELFVDGTEAGDVKQGGLGDCWFLGALSVVATRDDLLHPLFVKSDLERGEFTIKFYKQGEWKHVTIDDYIPCNARGEPVYARSAQLHEMWVMLIEKAYAKLHGSYAALEGGNVSEGLVDLTGGAPEELELHSDEGQKMYRSGELWRRLLFFQEEEWLMGCSMSVEDGEAEVDTGSGILQNHAYGIMKVVDAGGGLRMLQLRNPWGEKEWEGRWSDKSDLWTPSMKEKLSYVDANDGLFWMQLEDFVQYFSKMFICRLYEDEVGKIWQRHTFPGTWEGKNAGGSVNHESWIYNPQFRLKITHPDTDLFICLSQPDIRMGNRSADGYKNKIGFYLLRTDDATRKLTTTLTNDIVAARMTYLNVRQCGLDVKLEPGADYVIMISTFEPGQKLPYVLDVWSDEPCEVEPLPDPKEVTVNGNWHGASAGGCINHPSWKNNPMYYFTVPSQTKMSISLQQQGSDPPSYAGFIVFNASNNLRLPAATAAPQVFTSEITNAKSIGSNVDLAKGSYIIVPSTFDPHVERPFKLLFLGDPAPSEPTPCSDVAAINIQGEWIGDTAGGCPNHSSWRNNPQLFLDVKQAGKRVISVTCDKGDASPHVGFYIFRNAVRGQLKYELQEGDVACKTQFMPKMATVDVDLAPGSYSVLPCTFDKGIEASFEFSVVPSDGCSAEKQPAHVISSVSGAWSGSLMGGCTNNESWRNNPKYALNVPGGAGRITIVLAQGASQCTGIGFMVLKCKPQLSAPDDVVAESALSAAPDVVAAFDLTPGSYIIMPTTFDAGVNQTFDLTVFAATRFDLKAI